MRGVTDAICRMNALLVLSRGVFWLGAAIRAVKCVASCRNPHEYFYFGVYDTVRIPSVPLLHFFGGRLSAVGGVHGRGRVIPFGFPENMDFECGIPVVH